MKNLMLSLCMGVLFVVGLTSMVNTPPPPYDCQSDCEFLVGAEIFPTQGACMSACRSCTKNDPNTTVLANCYCKTSEAFYGDPEFGEKNRGACINMVKDALGGN